MREREVHRRGDRSRTGMQRTSRAAATALARERRTNRNELHGVRARHARLEARRARRGRRRVSSTRPCSFASRPLHTRPCATACTSSRERFRPVGDDVQEAVVEISNLALERRALVLVHGMERIEQRRVRAALERLGDDAELLHKRLDDDARGDDADGAVIVVGSATMYARLPRRSSPPLAATLPKYATTGFSCASWTSSWWMRSDASAPPPGESMWRSTPRTRRFARAARTADDEAIVHRERARAARDRAMERKHREHGRAGEARAEDACDAPRGTDPRKRGVTRRRSFGARPRKRSPSIKPSSRRRAPTNTALHRRAPSRARGRPCGLRDGVDELFVERVEHRAELLALAVAHLVEREGLASALVRAGREPLRSNAELVERALRVTRARDETDGRDASRAVSQGRGSPRWRRRSRACRRRSAGTRRLRGRLRGGAGSLCEATSRSPCRRAEAAKDDDHAAARCRLFCDAVDELVERRERDPALRLQQRETAAAPNAAARTPSTLPSMSTCSHALRGNAVAERATARSAAASASRIEEPNESQDDHPTQA